MYKNFKVLTGKRAEWAIKSYNGFRGYYLNDIYKCPSWRKIQAYNYNFNLFSSDNEARNFKCGNANSSTYCIGWLSKYEERACLIYITAYNNYIIYFD